MLPDRCYSWQQSVSSERLWLQNARQLARLNATRRQTNPRSSIMRNIISQTVRKMLRIRSVLIASLFFPLVELYRIYGQIMVVIRSHQRVRLNIYTFEFNAFLGFKIITELIVYNSYNSVWECPWNFSIYD